MTAAERQLTSDNANKDLDNNINFSPDGRFLVVDLRDEKGINGNSRLAKVDVETGKVTVFYEQNDSVLGVGAASFLNQDEVVAIHAIPGQTYDFTVRGGMIISADGTGKTRWLDSRDVSPPFTPGALRGGTHKHEPDSSGKWIGFTYNDHIVKFSKGSDLRNVGVSLRGIHVPVHPDSEGHNFEGESFSVLLTACVDHPDPGSDEYQRADGDCWVGPTAKARAFRGTVAVKDGNRILTYQEVFLVDLPPDITKPGPLGPLEGTETDYPRPPAGTVVRRLTRTAESADRPLRGISGHLRASGDGRSIAYLGKTRRDKKIESQVFIVSTATSESRKLSDIPGGVTGDPRFSPNSRYVAVAGADGAIYRVSALGNAKRLTSPSRHTPLNFVISPSSRLIAYNRRVRGILQVFTVAAQ